MDEKDLLINSRASPSSEARAKKSAKIKKILTYSIIAVFFFCGGVEFSVILPTCWDFMSIRFHSPKWLYGVTIAAMSISNLFIGPIMGGIYDRTQQTKLLVAVLLLFQIGGNFMYFAATSKYMVLGSRFVVGVGLSGGAVLFGELARVTTKKSRTAVFSLFMSTRQVGLVIGPACNLFLRICNFKIGPFLVDKYTAPGLFMTIIFSILCVMFILFFFRLPTVPDDEEDEEDDNTLSPIHNSVGVSINDSDKGKKFNFSTGSSTSEYKYPVVSHKGGMAAATPTPLSDSDGTILVSSGGSYGSINHSPKKELTSSQSSIDLKYFHLKVIHSLMKTLRLSKQLLREETVLLLSMMNFAMLAQLINETGSVPFLEKQFDWHELETSIVFSVAGIELIAAFVLASILSKFLADRWLILMGLIIELSGFLWLLGTFGRAEKFDWQLEALIIGIFLILLGLPIFIVAAAALYSKMLDSHIQGFGQGVRRSMISIASILGPLWAGAAFELVDFCGYYPYFGVSSFLIIFVLILLPFSFSKLKEPKSAKLMTNMKNKQ